MRKEVRGGDKRKGIGEEIKVYVILLGNRLRI